MNDILHTVEDAVSLPSTHHTDPGVNVARRATDRDPGVDLETLDYYRTLHGKHTFWARVALLTIIFGMLGANMWLTQRNYSTVILNVDQTRLAQAEMIDRQAELMEQQDKRITLLQQSLDRLEQAPATELVATAQ